MEASPESKDGTRGVQAVLVGEEVIGVREINKKVVEEIKDVEEQLQLKI